MILVTIRNRDTGLGYTYRAKSQKQANAWVNWIQEPPFHGDCPNRNIGGNCCCDLLITVRETNDLWEGESK